MSEHCRTDGGIGTAAKLFNYPENDEMTVEQTGQQDIVTRICVYCIRIIGEEITKRTSYEARH
jgi:hypothetical protein